MAPTTSATDTLFIDYTTTRLTHTLSLHSPTGGSFSGLVAAAALFLSDLVALFPDTTVFFQARRRPAGENYTVPETWASIAGTGTSAIDGYQETVQLGFGGRAGDGTRVTFQLYGHYVPPSTNFRITPEESTEGDTLLAAWLALAPSIATKSGATLVTKNNYINTRFNSAQQNRLRA